MQIQFLFVKIGKKCFNDITSLDRFDHFVYHHNNPLLFLDENESIIAGHPFKPIYISRINNNIPEYRAVFRDSDDSILIENWARVYFPDIKIYNIKSFSYELEKDSWEINTFDELYEILMN